MHALHPMFCNRSVLKGRELLGVWQPVAGVSTTALRVSSNSNSGGGGGDAFKTQAVRLQERCDELVPVCHPARVLVTHTDPAAHGLQAPQHAGGNAWSQPEQLTVIIVQSSTLHDLQATITQHAAQGLNSIHVAAALVKLAKLVQQRRHDSTPDINGLELMARQGSHAHASTSSNAQQPPAAQRRSGRGKRTWHRSFPQSLTPTVHVLATDLGAQYITHAPDYSTARQHANIAWALGQVHQHTQLKPAPAVLHALQEALLASHSQLLRTAKPQELANLALGLAKLNYHSISLSEALARAASPHLASFSPQELSNLVWGLSQSCTSTPSHTPYSTHTSHQRSGDLSSQPGGPGPPQPWGMPGHTVRPASLLPVATLLDQAMHTATQQASRFKPQELVSLLWSAAHVGKVTDAVTGFFEGALPLLLQYMHGRTLNGQDIGNSVWAYAKLHYVSLGQALLDGLIQQQPSQHQRALEDAAQAPGSRGSAAHGQEDSVPAVAAQLDQTGTQSQHRDRGRQRAGSWLLRLCSTTELVNVLWGCAVCAHHQQGGPTPEQQQLAAGILKHLAGRQGRDLSPQGAANCAWAAARLRLSDVHARVAILHHAAAQAGHMNPQELSNTLWSLTTLPPSVCFAARNRTAIGALLLAVRRQIGACQPPALAQLAWALGWAAQACKVGERRQCQNQPAAASFGQRQQLSQQQQGWAPASSSGQFGNPVAPGINGQRASGSSTAGGDVHSSSASASQQEVSTSDLHPMTGSAEEAEEEDPGPRGDSASLLSQLGWEDDPEDGQAVGTGPSAGWQAVRQGLIDIHELPWAQPSALAVPAAARRGPGQWEAYAEPACSSPGMMWTVLAWAFARGDYHHHQLYDRLVAAVMNSGVHTMQHGTSSGAPVVASDDAATQQPLGSSHQPNGHSPSHDTVSALQGDEDRVPGDQQQQRQHGDQQQQGGPVERRTAAGEALGSQQQPAYNQQQGEQQPAYNQQQGEQQPGDQQQQGGPMGPSHARDSLAQLTTPCIIQLLWALATMDHPHPTLLHEAAPVLSARIHRGAIRPRDVATVAWAYAKLQHYEPRLFSAILEEALTNTNRYDLSSWTRLAWAFSTLCLPSEEAFYVRLAQLQRQDDVWDGVRRQAQLELQLHGDTNHHPAVIPDHNHDSGAALHQRDGVQPGTGHRRQQEKGEPPELEAWFVAQWQPMLDMVVHQASHQLGSFRPADLSVLAQGLSYAQPGRVDLESFDAIGCAAAALVPGGGFSPGGLAGLLAAFARAQAPHTELLEVAAWSATNRMESYTPLQLANLMWALASGRVSDRRLLERAAGMLLAGPLNAGHTSGPPSVLSHSHGSRTSAGSAVIANGLAVGQGDGSRVAGWPTASVRPEPPGPRQPVPHQSRTPPANQYEQTSRSRPYTGSSQQYGEQGVYRGAAYGHFKPSKPYGYSKASGRAGAVAGEAMSVTSEQEWLGKRPTASRTLPELASDVRLVARPRWQQPSEEDAT